MQRIAKFLKSSDKSASKKSTLQQEVEQMRMKREELMAKLQSEKEKTTNLEEDMKGYQCRLDHRFQHYDDGINKNAALEKQTKKHEAEIEQLQNSNKENELFISKLAVLSANCGGSLRPEVMKQFVSNEKNQTAKYRQKMLHARQQLKDVRENSNCQPKPWKMCESCDLEFEESEQRVPRVLNCGHSFCHECAGKMIATEIIRCPFDGLYTDLRQAGLDTLPKNFTVLHM